MGCALRLNINSPEFRRYHHTDRTFVKVFVPRQCQADLCHCWAYRRLSSFLVQNLPLSLIGCICSNLDGLVRMRRIVGAHAQDCGATCLQDKIFG